MTRNRLLVIGGLAAAGLLAGLLLVFLGGDSNPPVAHVAGTSSSPGSSSTSVEAACRAYFALKFVD
jgi:hypothetical protein